MADSLNEIQPYMFEPEYEAGQTSGESGSDDGEVSSDGEMESNDPRSGRSGQPTHAWCTCTKCSHMVKDKECVCCQEWDSILNEKLDGKTCIVDHQEFPLICLEPISLCMAWIHFMAYKKLPGRAPEQLANRLVNIYTPL